MYIENFAPSLQDACVGSACRSDSHIFCTEVVCGGSLKLLVDVGEKARRVLICFVANR